MPEHAGSPHQAQLSREDIELIGRLRRTLGRLEAALASISDALVITDDDGRVLWCNQAFERLVDRPRLRVLGQAITAVLPPDAEGRALLDGRQLAGDGAAGTGTRAVLRHEPLQAVAIEWRPVLSEAERPLVFCIRDISSDLTSEAMRQEVQRIAAERQRLEQQALACAVTGLPNRRALEENLTLALRNLDAQAGVLTLLFCDLNGFKQVNDRHGHAAGDALLVTVGQRLQGCLRSTDLVARLGGDEFVVLSQGPGNAQEAMALALRLLEEVGRPWKLDGRILHPAMSVGIAITDDPELDGAELLRRADLAMYDAKSTAKLPVAMHNSALELRSRARLQLGQRLKRALDRRHPEGEGLRLAYRPIIALADSSVSGHEVQLRLEHPGEGAWPGADLLATAEPLGLSGSLGRWLRATALNQLGQRHGVSDTQLLAFTITAAELREPGLSGELQAQVRRNGLDPGRIALVLQAELLCDPPAALLPELESLRSLGVQLVLDGFGTGATPLPALVQLPLTAIRLHCSLAAAPDHSGRLRRLRDASVRLARELDLDVIAEGIESATEIEELRALGCRWGQGPHFGPPLL